jgi:hypothetical protein
MGIYNIYTIYTSISSPPAHERDGTIRIMLGTTKHYNYTKTYWVFGLCPSSGILKTREYNVLEIGSVSVLR